MSKAGVLLRAVASSIRFLEFLAAALILGIYSYFLAYLSKHHLHISTVSKAIEGLAGAAVIYTAFAVILTCFLGGISFFAFFSLLLDILFIGAFVAIAVLARDGARSCKGNAPSPLGNRRPTACRLETTVFAVAIIAAFLFLISAALAVLLNRHHRKEKKYGPSPSNNYTSGSANTGKKPFWARNGRAKTNSNHKDTELGTVAVGGAALAEEEKLHHHKNNRNSHNLRPSHDTAMTDSTAIAPEAGLAYGGPNTKYAQNEEPAFAAHHNTNNAAPYTNNNEPGVLPYPDHTPRDHHAHHHQNTGVNRGPTNVIHDSEPYAEVHHGGIPHSHPESQAHGWTGRNRGELEGNY